MHYDPIAGTPRGRGGDGETGAVPGRTNPTSNSPWVPPGVYSVVLSADGSVLTQPITIKLDPRVKLTPGVQQIFTLAARMEEDAQKAIAAQKEARADIDKLKTKSGSEELIKRLEEIAPAQAPTDPAAAPTLTTISGLLIGSVMSMQAAEMPPTSAELAASAKQESAYSALMAKWSALKATLPK